MYYAHACGKGRQIASAELEKLKLEEVSCDDAVNHIAKIMHRVRLFVLYFSFECYFSQFKRDASSSPLPKRILSRPPPVISLAPQSKWDRTELQQVTLDMLSRALLHDLEQGPRPGPYQVHAGGDLNVPNETAREDQLPIASQYVPGISSRRDHLSNPAPSYFTMDAHVCSRHERKCR